jgi:alanine dehydrogenase
VTATTASEPVFPPDSLSAGALVVAIGAYTTETQELAPAVVEDAAVVFADVPAEVVETGDFLGTDVGVEDLVALGRLLGDGYEQQSPEGVRVVASVGSAVLDAAAGAHLYGRAREVGVGTEVSL